MFDRELSEFVDACFGGPLFKSGFGLFGRADQDSPVVARDQVTFAESDDSADEWPRGAEQDHLAADRVDTGPQPERCEQSLGPGTRGYQELPGREFVAVFGDRGPDGRASRPPVYDWDIREDLDADRLAGCDQRPQVPRIPDLGHPGQKKGRRMGKADRGLECPRRIDRERLEVNSLSLPQASEPFGSGFEHLDATTWSVAVVDSRALVQFARKAWKRLRTTSAKVVVGRIRPTGSARRDDAGAGPGGLRPGRRPVEDGDRARRRGRGSRPSSGQ